MDTYSVKFMSGALQGEWMRHQTFRDVVKLYNILATMTNQTVSELYKDSFLWDESIGRWGVFTYKGWNDSFNAVLYIVREYPDE